MLNRIAVSIAAVVLLAAGLAGGAAAQPMYKSTNKDGKVVYGDKPTVDAVKVEEIQAPPPPLVSPGRSPAEEARIRKLSNQADQRGRERASKMEDAQKELRAAQEALGKAQENRTVGDALEPGERTFTGGGRSQPNEQYFARQKSLESAVEEAQKRVERAQAKVNDAR